ncbi:MAG: glycosyltransferase [Myxococcota bacterium]|nr:glycosyltransferase [Myxococcota bacterium]
MRIACVLHGWPAEEMGGTGLYVAALCAALSAGGHDVVSITPGVGPLGIIRESGHVRLQAPAPVRFEETWRRRALDGLLAAWLRQWRPDVLHIHHLSGLSTGLITVARRAGVRVVLTLHDYALPCARGQLINRDLLPCPGPSPGRCAPCLSEHLRLDPLSGAIGSLLTRWPALRRAAREQVGTLAPPPHAAARITDRLRSVSAALSAVDVLLSPSNDLATRFRDLGLPTPRVLPLPLIRPVPPAPAAPDGPVRFLFASSVIPTKGPHLLAEAFSGLSPGCAQLTIAGPTPVMDGQTGFIDDLDARLAAIPEAQRLGAVDASRVPALLAAHDVLVLPSLWPENSPLIVREAAAAGLPVIVSEQGGSGELVPEARRVMGGDIDGLKMAMAAEVSLGRRRLKPMVWPTPEEHASQLTAEVYR